MFLLSETHATRKRSVNLKRRISLVACQDKPVLAHATPSRTL